MSDYEYDSDDYFTAEEDEYQPSYDSDEEDYYTRSVRAERANQAIPSGRNVESYTLDHPLIADAVQYVEETLKGHPTSQRRNPRYERVAAVLRAEACKPIGHRKFHSWCATMWGVDLSSPGFESLWTRCNDDSRAARACIERGKLYRSPLGVWGLCSTSYTT